jgi:site-specific recombinase XerD
MLFKKMLLDAALPPRHRLILELLYGCGLRASELVGINLEDFSGSRRLARARKGQERAVRDHRRIRESCPECLAAGSGENASED